MVLTSSKGNSLHSHNSLYFQIQDTRHNHPQNDRPGPFSPQHTHTTRTKVCSHEMPLSRITPPSRIPTSAQSTALLQAISPAVLDPGSSVPADTVPGPAAAVDPPTPTAAMLASTRPVPSATAGYFRIHHVRFRTGGRGIGWESGGVFIPIRA